MAVIRKALKDFPELPEFHAEIGACYEIKGCYINAIEELLLSVDLYINYKATTLTEAGYVGEDVENILGHVESIIKKF